MVTEFIPITQVFPNIGQVEGLPKNPRFIRDAKYKKLLQSIKDDPEMLELRELIVYDTGDSELGYVVAGGNMRYKAMLELGYKEVPCKVLHTGFPIDKLRRIVLKDNSSFGETDFEALIEEWSLDEIDLAAIDVPEISDSFEDEYDEPQESDEESEEPQEGDIVEPENAPMEEEGNAEEDDEFEEDDVVDTEITQEGDLWKLGRHLLLCGDSTKQEDVKRLFQDEKADLWLTDPPYNVDYGSKNSFLNSQDDGNRIVSKIANDKMSNDAFLEFLTDAFIEAKDVMKAGASYYIFHSDLYGYYFRGALIAVGDMDLRETLIWNKNSLVLGRLCYHYKHEPCLFGWKAGASHNWYSDRKQTTVIDWDRPTKSVQHPTMKPVGLFGYLMKNSSKKDDIVYDGFGGSGTTLIAAEQLERRCRMIELSPHYCKVIIFRYIQLVGSFEDVYRVNADGTQTRIDEIVDADELSALCGKESF